ncbi:nucleoid-associated protein YejK [Pseudomonas asplenii]|uniref:Nucleoid-associated protein n=1 Tax=Pseudomonas asplenii TaxID=53407 RepID=A0A1H6NSV1_9PSED|nr:nucleoid-associated protein YejK [Pseudomonas fuscovaginae]SEI17034.1 nucleoid-associated protein [Pseudomonas fuscovaginae]
MPILNAVIHQIDKKPDGSPAVLHLANDKLPDSQAMDNLLFDLNGNYNAKQGKAWGYFQGESGAYPFSGWLSKFTADELDFVEFTRTAAEHLTKLLEESNLSTGGHVLFAHFRQGMTDYLSIAILQQVEAVAVASDLTVAVSRHLDASALSFAARINLSEWKNNLASRQYISFIKPKGARRATAYFRDFIGVTEGIDAAGETRTLLKAFSDFVESEDLAEDDAREKTQALVDYAAAQGKLGSKVSLEELSALLDEDLPANFAEFIRNKDYGLSPEIPADKKTINHFRRFTGRVEGLSISFEQHLLGNKVEFDADAGSLLLTGLPTPLIDQLKRATA